MAQAAIRVGADNTARKVAEPCDILENVVAHHFEFDHDHKILLVILEGDIDEAYGRVINEEIRHHIARLDPSGGITDYTGVTSFNMSGDVIRRFAQTPAPYTSTTLWFLVAPRDHIFGMARMYQLFAGTSRPGLNVVRSRKEAYAALGLQNPKFERVDS